MLLRKQMIYKKNMKMFFQDIRWVRESIKKKKRKKKKKKKKRKKKEKRERKQEK